LISEIDIFESLNDTLCAETACAVHFGHQLSADVVATAIIEQLEETIEFQYRLTEVEADSDLIVDHFSVRNLEELESLLPEVAESFITRIPVSEMIGQQPSTENEIKPSFPQRSRWLLGLAFGLLKPKHGYQNDQSHLIVNVRLGAEFKKFEAGILVGSHNGVAVNAFTNLLAPIKFIAPYLGVAAGYHWVVHADSEEYFYNAKRQEWLKRNKRAEGLELILNTGIKFRPSRHAQLQANMAYSYTFNDYMDQAVCLTLGLYF